MSNTIKILRHLEEHPQVINGDREGNILESERYLVDRYYAPEIVSEAAARNTGRIAIWSSGALRSQATSELIASSVEDIDKTIKVDLCIDTRIGALRHGSYKDDYYSENNKDYAQSIYIDETFARCNPHYKHGDPVLLDDGNYKYPNLKDIFSGLGESQIDITSRLYDCVLDILEQNDGQNELLVLSTHYVILTKLLSLQHLGAHYEETYKMYSRGNLYKLEWDSIGDIIGSCKYKDFFKVNNCIFDLNLDKIAMVQPFMIADLNYYGGEYESKD